MRQGRFTAIRDRTTYQRLHSAAFFMILILIVFMAARVFADDRDKVENQTQENSQQTCQTSDTLTEDEAIRLALSLSHGLESRDTRTQIADYRFDSAGRINNPELRISDLSTKYFTEVNDELRIGLRWRPPKLGELAEEKQQAKVNYLVRNVEAIRYREDLISKVRRNYADVILNDRLVELAEKTVDLESKRIRIIDKMVDFGIRSVVYQTKAKMWHSESKNQVTQSKQKQSLERRKLSQKTGVDENIQIRADSLPEIMLDLDQLLEIAYENRPEIELVQETIKLAEKQKNRELYKLILWPTFIDVSYHREEKHSRDWGEFMIGMDLPLFNWNNGNIKATDLAVKRRENQLDAVREGIEDEVRDAYNIYSELLLDWNNYNRDAKTMIQNSDTVIREARKHETLQSDEVLEMELTIIDMQKILCQKRRDLAHALYDLYYALGIEGPEKIIQDKPTNVH